MKELEKNIINMYGQKGKQFLVDLPHLIAQIKAEYGLSDLKPVNNLSYNHVLSGFQDKQAIILKLGLGNDGFKREAAALKAFSGFGAVTVLAEKEGMLLLERAISGASLKTYFPEKEYDAIHIMGGCLKKLHQAAPPFLKIFPHIKDWLMVLNKDSSIPDYYLNKARKLRDTLLETSSASVLLHGDLHHDNILQQGDDWVVIDPKGVIGEPAYEVAAFIRNPMPKLLELDNALKIIEHRIHHFAKILEISEHRIWNWCFVQAVLAWAWALEDNGDVSYFQQLTEIFDKKISVWGTRKTQIDTSLDRNLIVTQSPQCANLPAKPLELRFEALTIKDLEILHTWFQVPHVKKWYAKGLDFSKKDIELNV
ncbi:aminoglycoside phosphotransferase family protein [Candidatus Berkiella cookevillensis]|uniref:Aminoglycoside phosphotransferase family protein n=1 Tax=Candidatus Berkiella cookevillensis TaxID=437022 RepID=A0A0Q9YCE3_9GAMM|nr:aminoglycoside phosphotransferase family protein [Candidatus Berkiella cookevillensis]MCS5708701.1 aminoglycoside phosphotransferase family protein [Candidatus Berkiella cookevillensis]